jgi:hypothetical protein
MYQLMYCYHVATVLFFLCSSLCIGTIEFFLCCVVCSVLLLSLLYCSSALTAVLLLFSDCCTAQVYSVQTGISMLPACHNKVLWSIYCLSPGVLLHKKQMCFLPHPIPLAAQFWVESKNFAHGNC